MSNIELILGDCLEKMEEISKHSVDMVLTDLPYGTTACNWDVIIPLKPMWKKLKYIVKSTAAIALFGHEPFSSILRISNLSMFKYDWIWEKDKATNHLNVKRQPMRCSEIISVFYKKQCIYHPQLKRKKLSNIRPPTFKRNQVEIYGKMTARSNRTIPVHMSYPNEILKFRGCFGDKNKSFHPTQKPVALMEYLINTYTNKGDTVLDFCIGSGTTGVACQNLDRNFIGIEKDEYYFKIAKLRLNA